MSETPTEGPDGTPGPDPTGSTPQSAWTPADPPVLDAGTFVLHGTDEPDVVASAGRRSRHRFLSSALALGTALAVLVVAAGAVVAFQALSGGGPQPEKYAPASTFAFAKIDLDPSAGEKIAAYRFLKKFPSDFTDKLSSADEVKDELLGEVLPDSANYDSDIKPWLGDRIGIAAFLDGDEKPHAVAILAVKDHDKAQAELDSLTDKADESSAQGPFGAGFHIPFGYVLDEDYAILATSQKTAQLAVDLAADADLTTNSAYTADVDTLGGGQLVTAWADLDAAQTAFDGLDPMSLLGLLGGGFGAFGAFGGMSDAYDGQFLDGIPGELPPVPAPGAVPGVAPAPGSVPGVEAPSVACQREFRKAIRDLQTETGTVVSPFTEISPKCQREYLGGATLNGELHGFTSDGQTNGRALSSALLGDRWVSPSGPTTPELSGRVVLGLHLTSDYAELVARQFGGGRASAQLTSVDESLVTGLPDETVGAVAVGGLDDALRELLSSDSTAGLPFGFIDDALHTVGISRQDIIDAVGSQTAVALAVDSDNVDTPLVAVRTKPADMDAAERVARAVEKASDGDVDVVTSADGGVFTAANDADWLAAVQQGGNLGSTDGFADAVGPLDGTVLMLGYADVHAIYTATDSTDEIAENLDSVGFAAVRDGDTSTFRLRVVAH